MTTKKRLIRCIDHGVKSVRFCLASGLAIVAAGCAPAPEPTHRTVEYYRGNKEVRDARVAECANDPGALGKTPDCINAKQAAALEGLGSLRDMKPLGPSRERADSEGSPERAGTEKTTRE